MLTPNRFGRLRDSLRNLFTAGVAWILSTGAWDDTQPWDDTQTWKDAA